jgi:glycine hydroxymethyltransferase
MHIIAAKAVCFGEALKPEFKEYGKRVVENVRLLQRALFSVALTLYQAAQIITLCLSTFAHLI